MPQVYAGRHTSRNGVLTRSRAGLKRGVRPEETALAYTLVSEKAEHGAGIEAVLDRAFGPGRFAKTSERVRERGAVAEPTLSRVALGDAGELIGVCRIWRVNAGAPAYFLGPLGVDPGARNAGLGFALVREAVNACRAAAGAGGVLAVGAERFFAPLGFSVVPKGRLRLPGPVDPERLLWLELRPGGLDAVEGEVKAPR
jgi:predicted N-acetyltransferase YhbS